MSSSAATRRAASATAAARACSPTWACRTPPPPWTGCVTTAATSASPHGARAHPPRPATPFVWIQSLHTTKILSRRVGLGSNRGWLPYPEPLLAQPPLLLHHTGRCLHAHGGSKRRVSSHRAWLAAPLSHFSLPTPPAPSAQAPVSTVTTHPSYTQAGIVLAKDGTSFTDLVMHLELAYGWVPTHFL